MKTAAIIGWLALAILTGCDDRPKWERIHEIGWGVGRVDDSTLCTFRLFSNGETTWTYYRFDPADYDCAWGAAQLSLVAFGGPRPAIREECPDKFQYIRRIVPEWRLPIYIWTSWGGADTL